MSSPVGVLRPFAAGLCTACEDCGVTYFAFSRNIMTVVNTLSPICTTMCGV